MLDTPSKTDNTAQRLLKSLKTGLSKTRHNFSKLFAEKRPLDAAALAELETQLLLADIGVTATDYIIDQVKQTAVSDLAHARDIVIKTISNMLEPHQITKTLYHDRTPAMILTIGVNGAGKTTTVGKLAHYFKSQGKSVMLAAGDTFRAAATEQLQAWGERNKVPVIAQQPGADPAAVIFDAFSAAKARNIDILIADTSGRLHTQQHLMAELTKIKRAIQKIDTSAPHETLLIIDGTVGQNAINQAKQFNSLLGVSGIVITKLDGTAKGGAVVAISQQLRIPIKFIGIGEEIDKLQRFSVRTFVEALFA
jgi:fused signal recognition particle receptor